MAKSTESLKKLLDILQKGIKQEIKQKYEIEGPELIIDENFKIFYSHSNT
jgi:hypothetical protein